MLTNQGATEKYDNWIDNDIEDVLRFIESNATPTRSSDLPVYDVLRYHLGTLSASFQPETANPGKRLRSKLCLLCCEAAGGNPRLAVPVSASIELLHNFTLIHDDIQDMSELRRHRPTVWAIWGAPQAINAGDAMFAAAHVALNRSIERGVPPEVTLELSSELHSTTLRIVEGQVLDLGFEDRVDVSSREYLAMIGGKTAAIIRYACWAGARVAGLSSEQSNRFGELGQAIGMGFQIRDDFLGVWGATETTGKAPADDIRGRKESFPVLLLKERASDEDRRAVEEIYTHEEPDTAGIETVLALMDRYDIGGSVQDEVTRWHDQALGILEQLPANGTATGALESLLEGLVNRDV